MSLSRLANGNGHCVGNRHSVLYTFQVISPFSLKYFFIGCMCFHYCSKYSLKIFRVLSLYPSMLSRILCYDLVSARSQFHHISSGHPVSWPEIWFTAGNCLSRIIHCLKSIALKFVISCILTVLFGDISESNINWYLLLHPG
jgi:hypothetical protein